MTARGTALLVLVAGLAGPAAGDGTDGAALYVRHCARCHTTAGSGLPEGHPLLSNFRNPPADFTDPMFNSREPASDWRLVVAHGGTALGLSDQMPAHRERLTPAEIDAVVAHLGTFADTRGYPRGELNFTRPVRSIKAFPETELLFLQRRDRRDDGGDVVRSTLYHARRISPRWQLEAKLSQRSEPGLREVDEAELGAKWAVRTGDDRLLLAAGLDAEIPLRDDGDLVLVPYLSQATPLGGHFSLQGTLRLHLPPGTPADGDLELSQVVHWKPGARPRGVVPGLEATLVAPFDAEARWRLTLIPQVHAALSKRGHVALNLGLEFPVHGRRSGERHRLHAFVLWDMADGGFWQGW